MVKAPSTQVTTTISQSAVSKVEKQIRDRVINALSKRESEIEKLGETAAYQVISAIANGGGSVSAGFRSFHVSPSLSIETGPILRLLSDSEYVGEIGIPDPVSAIQHLKKTVPLAVTYRVRIFRGNIRITARFNPIKLIKLNPHPAKTMPNGQRISISSWLQWTTGPRFDTKGIPEYGLARVGDLAPGIRSASRTFNIAGVDAGLMLKLQPTRPDSKIGQFEYLTGDNGRSWKPSLREQNFWNNWWNKNKDVIKTSFNQIAKILINKVAAEELK